MATFADTRRLRVAAGRRDATALATWGVALALPAYLALQGGGYDGIVRGQVGICVWWAVIVGAAAGVLPGIRLTRTAWTAIGLLAAFAAWTALSAAWSPSAERSAAEAARMATYLGILVLALAGVRRGTARRLRDGLACAIVLVAGLALLSRLHPAWFPANDTAHFLQDTRSRLNYPVNYWNGLAALLALGLPLLLTLAAAARTPVGRIAAAGSLPVLATTIYLTYSRGGIVAAAVAVVVVLVTAPRVRPVLGTLAVAGAGTVVLVAAIAARGDLADGIASRAADHQGRQVAVLVILVVAAVCCGQAALIRFEDRPRLRVALGRRTRLGLLGGGLALALVLLFAGGAGGRLGSTWTAFKDPQLHVRAAEANHAQRLTAISGNGRYQYWASSVDAVRSHPVAGIGAGTWEFWWAQRASLPGFVRNAHSLWFETAAELGLVGLLLLVGFLLCPLATGVARLRRASPRAAWLYSGALGGLAAFCASATYDWVWQLGAVAGAALMLAALLLAAPEAADRTQRARRRRRATRRPIRAGLVVAGVVAIAALVPPLVGLVRVRESQRTAQHLQLDAALAQARVAARAQPYAGTPLAQQALILEAGGDVRGALGLARRAVRAEATNWRQWLLLSRLRAENGDAAGALRAYRRARTLGRATAVLHG